MSKRDYYEVLGVDKSAGEREIKKAYKKLAMKFTLTVRKAIKAWKINLKKSRKPTKFCQIRRNVQHTTNMAMRELIQTVVAVASVVVPISAIFLATYLAISLAVAEVVVNLAHVKVQTFAIT